jgi:hypothetical protein
LHDNLVLFGDNAYLSLKFMVTPFPNVSSGSNDNFIFFTHSFVFELNVRLGCWLGVRGF